MNDWLRQTGSPELQTSTKSVRRIVTLELPM